MTPLYEAMMKTKNKQPVAKKIIILAAQVLGVLGAIYALYWLIGFLDKIA